MFVRVSQKVLQGSSNVGLWQGVSRNLSLVKLKKLLAAVSVESPGSWLGSDSIESGEA